MFVNLKKINAMPIFLHSNFGDHALDLSTKTIFLFPFQEKHYVET